MTPKLSVIVSVYNQAQFLPTLLSSLQSQQCPVPYEVLICDDGSTDSTGALVREWPDLDLRHIWQPDRGFRVSRSRNNGIRCAQGDVLVFLDGDSVLRPLFLRDHWDAHAESCRLVCGACQHVLLPGEDMPKDPDTFFALPRVHTCERSDWSERHTWLSTERPWMACTSGNMSVPRAAALLFDESFNGWGSEDRDFAFRAYAAGLRVTLLERVNLAHVLQPNQSVAWNPTKGGDARSVVAALHAKLRLLKKYPGELMAPSLELVRFLRYESQTDTWRVVSRRRQASARDVLAEFEAWLESHAGDDGACGTAGSKSNTFL